MRKKVVEQKEVIPDLKYNSPEVTKLIQKIMQRGKKELAINIVYRAFDYIQQKTGQEPLSVFEEAISNTWVKIETKSRKVGGSNMQVPVEVRPKRALSLSLKWIVTYAATRRKAMEVALAEEIMDAAKGQGGAHKKREDVLKMAESNKAFAHYRW